MLMYMYIRKNNGNKVVAVVVNVVVVVVVFVVVAAVVVDGGLTFSAEKTLAGNGATSITASLGRGISISTE